MGKGKTNAAADLISESVVDKILGFIKEMVEESKKENAISDEEKKELSGIVTDAKKEIINISEKELKRVSKALEKTDPATNEYYELTRVLYQYKHILEYYS